uniref:Uncharacterized protein n=1 Tax=Amphiprion ocellaris TaxID=80972 RepID=A0A3Q1CVD1_AMPOC
MGCNESRCWSLSHSDKSKETEHRDDETEEFLKHIKEDRCVSRSVDPPLVSIQTLDFASRMSEDIVAQALQLCWQVEHQHQELPFIDSDSDYII